MKVSLFVAMAQNRVIGRGSQIPWKIPGEQLRLKQRTTGHTVIMGRKTYESIGRPLPRRTNIVISRRSGYEAPGCIVVADIEAALAAVPNGEEEAFVLGGGEIYRQTLERADRIYLTIVHRNVEGDVYFPEFAPEEFTEVERELVDGEDPYTFSVLDRIAKI